MRGRERAAYARAVSVPPTPTLVGAAGIGRISSPILIGRDAELGALVRAVATPPALVLVEGEAGAGKTRLVAELMAQPALKGRATLIGHCQSLRDPLTLGPVTEAILGASSDIRRLRLSPVTGALRRLLPELADSLPPEPESLGDHLMERHRQWRALCEILESLGPTVLILEDLHWVDETTSEFLRYLVSQQSSRLALVLTYREEDLPEASRLVGLASHLPSQTTCLRLSLSPLGRDDVRKLIGSIMETLDVSSDFADHVHERTSGLPLAVEEVLRLLQDRRDIISFSGRWARRALGELEVPEAVREAILERLNRLSPDARCVVEAAAVLGDHADEQRLCEVGDLSRAATKTALLVALAAALLSEHDERYGFRHTLARQAVYESTPAPVRRSMHLRAAHTLLPTKPPPFALLAHHFKQAGRPEEWAQSAEKAADIALSLGDDTRASSLLQDVLSAPRVPTEMQARLAVKYGEAALHGVRQGEAIPVLRRIVGEDDLSSRLRGELRFFLAILLHQNGDASAARIELTGCVADLESSPDGPPALLISVMSNLALPAVLEGHVSEHLEWLERALDLSVREGDDVVRRKVLADRASNLLAIGEPAGWQAVQEIPRDDAFAGRRESVRIANNLAQSSFWLGHYAVATSFIGEGARLSEEFAYPRFLGALETTRLMIAWASGQWEGLEDRVRASVERDAEIPHAVVDVELVLAALLLGRGAVDEAMRLFEKVRVVAGAVGSIPILAAAGAGVARVRLSRRQLGPARSGTADAMAVIERKGIWVWATDLAPVTVRAFLSSGLVAEATQYVSRFAEGLEGRDAPAASAALTLCRATLADHQKDREGAVALYEAAERAWRELPRPYDAALTLESWGRCVVAETPEAGADLLGRSVEAFGRLGAAWDEARVRRVIRELGLAAPKPRQVGRRSYGSELSPREDEVAVLAATGATNREIADDLCLSPWTVANHVASALQKLGLESRREFAAVRDEKNGSP